MSHEVSSGRDVVPSGRNVGLGVVPNTLGVSPERRQTPCPPLLLNASPIPPSGVSPTSSVRGSITETACATSSVHWSNVFHALLIHCASSPSPCSMSLVAVSNRLTASSQRLLACFGADRIRRLCLLGARHAFAGRRLGLSCSRGAELTLAAFDLSLLVIPIFLMGDEGARKCGEFATNPSESAAHVGKGQLDRLSLSLKAFALVPVQLSSPLAATAD